MAPAWPPERPTSWSSSNRSSAFGLNTSLSDDEDAGAAEGWSIGDSRSISAVTMGTTTWSTSTNTLQIRVNGSTTALPTEVGADWPFVPDDVSAEGEGGEFRLLFLSSTTGAATSTNIADYNTFVQTAAAAGHAAIQDYSDGFRAVVSTAAVDARGNSATTGPSAPIYWLGGAKLADHYPDFYDGSWDDEANPTDESGAAISPGSIWTGSASDGTKGVHTTTTAQPCWAAPLGDMRRSGVSTPQPSTRCPAIPVGGRSPATSTPSPRCSRSGRTRPALPIWRSPRTRARTRCTGPAKRSR